MENESGEGKDADNNTVDTSADFKVTANVDSGDSAQGPGSSSGGCNAGFGILGLALAGTLFMRKRG